MKKKRRTRWLLTILFIVLILVLTYSRLETKKQYIGDFNQFNQTNIDGEIENVGIKHHGTSFKIKNNDSEFVFYPYRNEKLKNGFFFEYTVTVGSRVIKPAYSDTLILLKNESIYKYTFQHPK